MLAGLGRGNEILSQVSTPTLHSPKYGLSQSDLELPNDSSIQSQESDIDWDTQSLASKNLDKETHVTENDKDAQAEENTTTTAPISAGTSLHGNMHTMSQKMVESVSQWDFYGTRNMHYMAQLSTIGETPEDLFHDAHLELQEHMRNPITFHAEMVGDIMYLQLALRQQDSKLFVKAVIKEVNGHMDNKNCELVHWDTVPEDAQIVPSIWSMQRKCDLTTNEVKSH